MNGKCADCGATQSLLCTPCAKVAAALYLTVAQRYEMITLRKALTTSGGAA